MRRETRKSEEKNKNIMYLAGSIIGIVVIVFAISFLMGGSKPGTTGSKLDTGKIGSATQNIIENTSTASTQIGKTVEESKKEENTINNQTNTKQTNENKTAINTTKETTKKQETNTTNNTTAKTETKKEEIKETKTITFTKPVEGEIYKEYAKDNLIYSQTLEEWTTHLGIDIKTDSTTVVKAAADGKVKSIKNDPRYGLSVVIEHQDGYETLCASLLTAEFVKVGEEVKQGQTIGTVGTSASFEIADGAHLHFEITKDGESIDPTPWIK